MAFDGHKLRTDFSPIALHGEGDPSSLADAKVLVVGLGPPVEELKDLGIEDRYSIESYWRDFGCQPYSQNNWRTSHCLKVLDTERLYVVYPGAVDFWYDPESDEWKKQSYLTQEDYLELREQTRRLSSEK